MTLKMTTAQVVETSVTVTNSSFQNYTHPDDHTTRTTDTPGFKPFTINQLNMIKKPKALNFKCLSKASIFLGFITIASNFLKIHMKSCPKPWKKQNKKKTGLITNYCLIIQSFIIFLQLLCLRFSCESKYFNPVYVFKPVYFFQTTLTLPNFFFYQTKKGFSFFRGVLM